MWMKIDDGLHAHRKARRVTSSHPDKRRDSSPMGLWIMAGSWTGQNGKGDTTGWVPEHELDRWDDDWEDLADRLVKAGFWWPEERDGEPGFGFVDWQDYNPSAGAAEAGARGNHERWHVARKVVSPDCPLCPSIPTDIDDPDPGPDPENPPTTPNHRGAIGGRIRSDIAPDSQNIALPDPTRPDPTPLLSPTDVDGGGDRFEEFWDVYAKKDGKKDAQKKWKTALRKKGVTEGFLIAAAKRYVSHQQAKGKHPDFSKNPSTWLNGEHWNDELPTLQAVAGDHYVHKSIDEFEYRDD